ncbi:beta-1,4-glucuronyltransferase 1-like [Scaptodrosophila lebanonensis]|uniref:Beta-1,4-glucuronyltransferase 1-like n=1 Tax=Drosophila lebanonensis TaxID=7225 RepID=A0A6J2TZT6_DROLE|nr:beta-1,4-glucuronyltransferase 1-like [Scaptodrosophila lebanonensis]XP_030381170.1 beta-1,4-glucuronyltransferase 1-like [Scaptodrosophila lebanonensis]
MALYAMCNKRYLRVWPLAVLLLLTLVLVLHNLKQALLLNQNTYWMQEAEMAPPTVSPRTIRLFEFLNCTNRPLRLQRLQHGDYWLLQNLVVGQISRHMGCAESITLTTNADYTFFDNLEMLVQRWLGPISFAIFAPGRDVNDTLDAIQYVRNCLPSSDLIRDYVTFHIYFPNGHMPTYVPYDEAEALTWPYKCFWANGSVASPPYLNREGGETYRVQKNLTYPINVGRNIARKAANTHFIFANDIELIPSTGIVDQFLDMVDRNHSVLALDPKQPRRVFPFPVYELQQNESVPAEKAELLTLLKRKGAQIFHSLVCARCHRVPGQQKWLQNNPNITNELQVISVGLRMGPFRTWEPFYVSDNTEPLFDERVTWEGQSNKRIQGYAMCLLGYEYHVLHPAFLAHSPGIKKPPTSKSPRLKYAREMTRFIKSKIEPEYRVLFGNRKNCTT